MKAATLFGGVALAVLVSPMATGAFAAMSPHATAAESNIVLAAAKGQAGSCGKMMYWSAKEGKCVDFRSQPKSESKGAGGGEAGWVSECMKGHAGC